MANRDLKQLRWRRSRKRHKSNRFSKQNNNSSSASRFLVDFFGFFDVQRTITTMLYGGREHYLFRFITWTRAYSRVHLHFTKLSQLNKRDKVWKNAKAFAVAILVSKEVCKPSRLRKVLYWKYWSEIGYAQAEDYMHIFIQFSFLLSLNSALKI